MPEYNKVISLLSRGIVLPEGWGFPPLVASSVPACGLRNDLMFARDRDGKAQLCRYYHGILRGAQHVWRSLAGIEGYQPAAIALPRVYSPTAALVRSPSSGLLYLGWVPGPEVKTFTGLLECDEHSATLVLGDQEFTLPAEIDATTGIADIRWPAHLKLEAGIADYIPGDVHDLNLRPSRFDLGAILTTPEPHYAALDRVGILSSYLAAPRPEDKIAVAWLAVALVEQAAE